MSSAAAVVKVRFVGCNRANPPGHRARCRSGSGRWSPAPARKSTATRYLRPVRVVALGEGHRPVGRDCVVGGRLAVAEPVGDLACLIGADVGVERRADVTHVRSRLRIAQGAAGRQEHRGDRRTSCRRFTPPRQQCPDLAVGLGGRERVGFPPATLNLSAVCIERKKRAQRLAAVNQRAPGGGWPCHRSRNTRNTAAIKRARPTGPNGGTCHVIGTAETTSNSTTATELRASARRNRATPGPSYRRRSQTCQRCTKLGEHLRWSGVCSKSEGPWATLAGACGREVTGNRPHHFRPRLSGHRRRRLEGSTCV